MLTVPRTLLFRAVFLALFVVMTSPETVRAATGYLQIIGETEDPKSPGKKIELKGVQVFVNGKLVGETPLTGIPVPAGRVEIRAEKDGYGSGSQIETVPPDRVTTVVILLSPTMPGPGGRRTGITIQQDRGHLLVINQIGMVPVLLNGVSVGTGSIDEKNLPAGKYRMRVGDFEKEIRIYKDHQLQVFVTKAGIEVRNDLEQIERERKEAEKRAAAAEAKRRQRIFGTWCQSKINRWNEPVGHRKWIITNDSTVTGFRQRGGQYDFNASDGKPVFVLRGESIVAYSRMTQLGILVREYSFPDLNTMQVVRSGYATSIGGEITQDSEDGTVFERCS